MGLLSKKTLVCERCGKEYQALITFGAHICDECKKREADKKADVSGYVDYAQIMSMPKYTEAQLDEIAHHRDSILEKYRVTDGITRSELFGASEDYKKLTDAEAENVLRRIANSSITSTMGAAYSGYFFVPTGFDKMIVDAQDVFAVGYTGTTKYEAAGSEVLMCAFFTNDQYVPVFSMIYVGKLGFFELSKSKSGRAAIENAFSVICPNLTYPVQDLKNLKKQIKADGNVKGNIDLKFMLNEISNASSDVGVFGEYRMKSSLSEQTSKMLDEYGYILDTEINQILKLDKMFNRKYWEKQVERIGKNV